jgi:hypothetical protein
LHKSWNQTNQATSSVRQVFSFDALRVGRLRVPPFSQARKFTPAPVTTEARDPGTTAQGLAAFQAGARQVQHLGRLRLFWLVGEQIIVEVGASQSGALLSPQSSW